MRQKSESGVVYWQAGQTLLIVILIMVIALTVGLAVVSRSVTNLRTSTEEENSERAFSAAEAGVEQAIKKGYLGSGLTIEKSDLGNSSSFKTDISVMAGTEFVINGGSPVEADDGIDIWLSTYPGFTDPRISPANFNIYWGLPTENNCTDQIPAAIEAIVLTGTVASPVAKRYLFDPCVGTRGNSFDDPVDGPGSYPVGGKNFGYRAKVGSIINGLLARIIPLYKRTSIGVNTCIPGNPDNCTGAISLPSQGNKIDSVGTYKSTDRKITYYQGFPSLPSEFFQYAVFSAR